MLGWEFPPFISGGLGTACFGLTRGLDEVGVEVCFVLPTAVPIELEGASDSLHVQLRTPADLFGDLPDKLREDEEIAGGFEHLEIHRLAAALRPYGTPQNVEEDLRRLRRQGMLDATKQALRRAQKASSGEASESHPTATDGEASAPLPHGSLKSGEWLRHYEGDLMGQVKYYTDLAVKLGRTEQFDVIHAHDWMTYPAATAVARATGKPLVVQVHSTEFDRSGGQVNKRVCNIERTGMRQADKVICVSYLTRNIVMKRYGVPKEKIEVVYNAVDLPPEGDWGMKPIGRNEKIVLFLGRVTMQKGPEYFLRAAKKVVEKFQDVRFVMAGSGDMIKECIQLAADLKLGQYVTFTGFLRGEDVQRVFEMADLYVMPSVSEPFGIAPLEALSHNVPVIISKQSGVSEVLTHVLKVDFWDTDEMANKVLAVLRHEPLRNTLRQQGQFELEKFSWRDSAMKLKRIYKQLISAKRPRAPSHPTQNA